MANNSVVITGATQGLGFAYAREFLARGVNVLICGRDSAAVSEAVAKLAANAMNGARVVGQSCDIGKMVDLQALWDRGVREFGRIDIWLNNAGYAKTGATFLATTPEQIAAMMNTNVIGSMNATQVAMAGMRQHGGGRVYITLGGGGATGRVVPGMAAYSTTKRALKYFADSLVKEAIDAKKSGTAAEILIGTISPGINITEGMLREIAAVPAGERNKMLKPLNFIGEHVETTSRWIVERILADTRQGNAIVWLTTGRMLKRGIGMLFKKRDILSRYGLTT